RRVLLRPAAGGYCDGKERRGAGGEVPAREGVLRRGMISTGGIKRPRRALPSTERFHRDVPLGKGTAMFHPFEVSPDRCKLLLLASVFLFAAGATCRPRVPTQVEPPGGAPGT